MRIPSQLRAATLSLIATVTLCSEAGAQALSGSLADVSSSLQPGTRVEVVRTDGSVAIGSLTRASEAGLVLDVEGAPVDLPATTIAEISRRGDPLRNGLIVGAGTGLLSGFVLGLVLGGSETGETSEDILPGLLLMGVGAGVGLGALFDAISEGKTVVFRATAQPSRIALVPTFGKGRKGVALSLSF